MICDVGRSMGEAMAGVVQQRPRPAGLARGRREERPLRRRLLRRLRQGRRAAAWPAARTTTRRRGLGRRARSTCYNDSADELMLRVLRRRPGSARTVVEDARLGDLRPAQDPGPARHLLRQGDLRVRLPARGRRADQPRACSEGTLTKRCGDGMVMYETEREELEEMPLVRSDGLPTQHMRALAYWSAAPELDDIDLAAGLRQRVGRPRHLPPPADRRARRRQRQRQRQRQGRRPADPRRLPRHGRPRTRVDHLEQEGRAADRRPGRVDRRADRGRPGARRGAPRATRRRTAIAAAGRARLLPPAADHQAGRLRAGEAAARGAGQPRLGPGAGPGPPRHGAAGGRARRPRTPTTASPSSSRRSTGATCAARSRSSTSARWPATSPTSPAGTARTSARPRSSAVVQAVLDQGVRGLGLEASLR